MEVVHLERRRPVPAGRHGPPVGVGCWERENACRPNRPGPPAGGWPQSVSQRNSPIERTFQSTTGAWGAHRKAPHRFLQGASDQIPKAQRSLAGMMAQGRLGQAKDGGEAVWQARHNVWRGAGPSRSPAEGSLMRGAGPSRSPAEGSHPQRGQRVRNALLEGRALPKGASRWARVRFRSVRGQCQSAGTSLPFATREALSERDLIRGFLGRNHARRRRLGTPPLADAFAEPVTRKAASGN